MNEKQKINTTIMDEENPENNSNEKLANTKRLEDEKLYNREVLIRQARAKLVKKANNEFALLMQELKNSSEENN